VNNVLAFPGIFRGLLDVGATRVTMATKVAAAEALADLVDVPCTGRILPGAFEPGVSATVAAAVRRTAQCSGHVRR
jgi:malate dehydrogenase (oxaloacetate-decarboxylating)